VLASLVEGQQLVRATEKYNRIVQHGTNSRSNAAVREGIQKLREGVIGDVYLARGLCFNGATPSVTHLSSQCLRA